MYGLSQIGLCALALSIGLGSGVSATNQMHFRRQEAPGAAQTSDVTSQSTSQSASVDTASAVSSSVPTSSSTSGSQTTTTATTTTASESSGTSTGSTSAEETTTETNSSLWPSGTALPPKDKSVKECHVDSDADSPFCSPDDGQDVYVDNTYYVTWDITRFPSNSTITVGIEYENVTENQGAVATMGPRTPNNYGYTNFKMDKSWLKGESRNNLTIYLVMYDKLSDEKAPRYDGPTVTLTKEPVKHLPPPPHTPAHKLGMMIGLPIGLVAVVIIVLGLFCGMKRHRHIGIGSIMGSRSKGYGTGRSRIERLGGRGRRRGSRGIRLDDMEGDAVDQYSDHPRPESPGHRMATDTELFNDMQRKKGNVFRAEIGGMKNWK